MQLYKYMYEHMDNTSCVRNNSGNIRSSSEDETKTDRPSTVHCLAVTKSKHNAVNFGVSD